LIAGRRELNPQIAPGVVLTLLAMTTYGGLHSVLASDWAKGKARSLFGSLADRWYRFAFNVVGAISFLPVLAFPALFPGVLLYRLEFPWIVLSSAIQLSAVLLLLLALQKTDALRFLGLRQLAHDQLPPPQMVVDGPYRWVRHPLYTAGLLFIWAVPVMTTTSLALTLGISAYLYVGSIFEESRLLSLWGEQYRDYRRQVPRLIPLPWMRYK
jgi:protein-S-isoprenylcysteine O-methyltransferase Ste14